MKQVEFSKDFTTNMRHEFPSANIKRLDTLVLVSTPREMVAISSLRDVVTIKHAYNGKLDTYVTDWKKAFKPNMVAVSIDKVAELLELQGRM